MEVFEVSVEEELVDVEKEGVDGREGGLVLSEKFVLGKEVFCVLRMGES